VGKVRTQAKVKRIIDDYLKKYGKRGDIKRYWNNISPANERKLFKVLKTADILNFRRYCINSNYTFIWDQSPEGHDYWQRFLPVHNNEFVDLV